MARAQWVALQSFSAVPDHELRELLAESYRLVWERLPKKRREALAGTDEGKSKPKPRASAIGQEGCEIGEDGEGQRAGTAQMKTLAAILCGLLWSGTVVLCAQSGSEKTTPPAANSGSTAAKPAAISASTLEQDFFAIVRRGDTAQFLTYVPEDGVNVGPNAQLTTRSEIEDQFAHHSGLYCTLFDSSCIQSTIKLDASTPPCSYRELLTQSEKVRTAPRKPRATACGKPSS